MRKNKNPKVIVIRDGKALKSCDSCHVLFPEGEMKNHFGMELCPVCSNQQASAVYKTMSNSL